MKRIAEINVIKKDAGGTVLSSEKIDMVNSIVCNRCAQELWKLTKDGSCDSADEWLEVNNRWGFNSLWDLEEHEWHLCQKCYSEVTRKFKIPVSLKQYHPLK